MQRSLPVAERPRRPEWMKVRAPSADSAYFDVRKLIHGASLNTICEEARCPNISECWGRGTATFAGGGGGGPPPFQIRGGPPPPPLPLLLRALRPARAAAGPARAAAARG